MKETLGDAPPTIGTARRLGVVTLLVECGPPCRRTARVGLDMLQLPDETPFHDIATRKRLVCADCGRRAKRVSVDWDKLKDIRDAG